MNNEDMGEAQQLIGKKVVPTFRMLEGNLEFGAFSLLSVNNVGIFIDNGILESRFVPYSAIAGIRPATEQEIAQREKDIKELDLSSNLKDYLNAVRFDSFDGLIGKRVLLGKDRWKRPGLLNSIIAAISRQWCRERIESTEYTGKVLAVDKEGIRVDVDGGYSTAKSDWEPPNGSRFFPFDQIMYVAKEDKRAAKKYLGFY